MPLRPLSDDLVRQLVAVGQVDILVGVSVGLDESVVERACRLAHLGLTTHFPRARTVLVSFVPASPERPVGAARGTLAGAVSASHALRTSHRITAALSGMDAGRAEACQVLFTAAELLRAETVVVLEPDALGLAPEWVAVLAGPVRERHADFVAPVYSRPRREGLFVTQLLRPLVRATYARRLDEPLVEEFACTGGFAAHCLEHVEWNSESVAHGGVDAWLTGMALAGPFRAAQAMLGSRAHGPGRGRPGLRETFLQATGGLFSCLVRQSDVWLERAGSEVVPTFGEAGDGEPEPAVPDLAPMSDAFVRDVGHLTPVLKSILAPATLSALHAVVAKPDALHMPDETWADTVYQFLLAYHRDVMRREHITQALLPLYLGRVASFLREHEGSDQARTDQALEALAVAFESGKSSLAAEWHKHS